MQYKIRKKFFNEWFNFLMQRMFQFLLSKEKLSKIRAGISFLGLICHLVEHAELAESSTLWHIPAGSGSSGLLRGCRRQGAALQLAAPVQLMLGKRSAAKPTLLHTGQTWNSDISATKQNSCKLPNVRNGPAIYNIYGNLLSLREAQTQNQDLHANTGFQTEKQKRHFGTCLQIAGNALLLHHKNKAGKTELAQASASEAIALYLEQDVYFTFYSEHFSKAAKPVIPKSNSYFLSVKP